MRAWELLFEASGKNVHLVHLEDLIFDHGYKGAMRAVKLATGVRNTLAQGRGKQGKVTVKWDGSPAIITGIDPADGKFFIGTKSAFAKASKTIKRPGDVEKYYSEQPELGIKLLAAFNNLRKLGIKGILQGDLMFTDGDVKEETIDGADYLTFTPNTITYAVPVDSNLGNTIKRAKLGIVFHTAYDGEGSLQNVTSSFDVDISNLKKTPDVWFDDATYKDYTGIASLTPEEDAELKREIIAAKARISELGKNLDVVIENPEFKKNLPMYINQNVREGEHMKDPYEFTKDFLEFYKGRVLKDIDKIKSDKAINARHQKISDKELWIEEHKETIYKIIDLYNHLNEIKLVMVNKLNTLDGLKTFIRSYDGYDVTNPEGFVAVGHDGNAVKLVDRLEFSRQNFNKEPR